MNNNARWSKAQWSHLDLARELTPKLRFDKAPPSLGALRSQL